MSVVDLLEEALKLKSWEKVEEAYSLLGGKPKTPKKRGRKPKTDNFLGSIINSDEENLKNIYEGLGIDQRTLNAIHEGSGETPPQSSLKVGDNLVDNDGKVIGKVVSDKFEYNPEAKIITDIQDFHIQKSEPVLAEGQKKPAKLVPYQPPKTNLFNPKISPDREKDMDRINDNVTPTPRTRPAAVYETQVFCHDCQKMIKMHPSLVREPYNCEYIKARKRCPNVG